MNALKQIRFNKRMNQYQLSLLSGVQQSRISLIENDLISPREDERKRISKALGVSPGDIWRDENQKEGR